MNDFIRFLVSEEAILVYIVALVISVFYVLFYFIKKTSHERKKRQNTMELKRLVSDVDDALEHTKKEEAVNTTVTPTNVVMPTVSVVSPTVESSQKVVTTPTPVANNNVVVENSIPTIEKPVVDKPEPIVVQPAVQVEETNKSVDVIPSVLTISPEVSSTVNVKEEQKNVTKFDKEKALDEFLKSSPVEVMESEPIETIKIEELEPVPSVEKIEKVSDNNIEYTSIEPNEEEAKKQLKEAEERLELEENTDRNIELTEFEKLQEDTAIISLDELMKKAEEMYERNEEIQYKDEGNEPISLADLEKRKQEVMMEEVTPSSSTDVEQLTLDDIYNVKITPVVEANNTDNEHKFKSSPVISPVYGIEKSKDQINKNTDIELENTANYEKLDEEIRKTNEFIAALKELQKKLD